MIAAAIRAVTIRRFLVMISFTALIPQAPRSAMTARQPDRDGPRRKMDWLPQHGCWQRHTGQIHRVHGVLPGALPHRGGQGDPTKAPDITINSWGCPASEGCSANTLQAAVEAQAAAGIMMVVAAGNSALPAPRSQIPHRFMQHLTPSGR
jgi:hypothetical protein